jgi:peptidoglycan-N-acetylglucosamine deacetylase
MVRSAPGLAREIVERGHDVALHGDVHRSHVLRSPHDVVADMRRSHDLIVKTTNQPLKFFRPPYGSLSMASLFAARQLGLRPILWGAWGRDWRAEATPETVWADLQPHVKAGATLLLHDSDCTSAPLAWKSALGALRTLAEHLESQHLCSVPLSAHFGN